MAWDGYRDTGAYWMQRQMARRQAEYGWAFQKTRPMVMVMDIPRLTAVVHPTRVPPSLPDWFWLLVLALVLSWATVYALALIRL